MEKITNPDISTFCVWSDGEWCEIEQIEHAIQTKSDDYMQVDIDISELHSYEEMEQAILFAYEMKTR